MSKFVWIKHSFRRSSCFSTVPVLGRSSQLFSVVNNHGDCFRPLRIGLWTLFSWLINGGRPNHAQKKSFNKPFLIHLGHLEGEQAYSGDLLPMVINHVSKFWGPILQVAAWTQPVQNFRRFSKLFVKIARRWLQMKGNALLL